MWLTIIGNELLMIFRWGILFHVLPQNLMQATVNMKGRMYSVAKKKHTLDAMRRVGPYLKIAT